MQNFKTLGQPLLGEKYVAEKKERKKRKIIAKIVDTSFRSNANGQRMHSARTNITKPKAVKPILKNPLLITIKTPVPYSYTNTTNAQTIYQI